MRGEWVGVAVGAVAAPAVYVYALSVRGGHAGVVSVVAAAAGVVVVH